MNETKVERITIEKDEYSMLRNAQRFLSALQVEGVDEWSGYDKAKELLSSWNEINVK